MEVSKKLLKKIDHIGIAVKDLGQALSLYRDTLGVCCLREEEIPSEKVRVAFLPVESVNLELLEPSSPDSVIAKFLDRRGPGIHHICYAVENIEETLKLLQERGVRLIDEKPRSGAHGSKVAFLHPASTGGVLIELKES